jgi:hypothetical protein
MYVHRYRLLENIILKKYALLFWFSGYVSKTGVGVELEINKPQHKKPYFMLTICTYVHMYVGIYIVYAYKHVRTLFIATNPRRQLALFQPFATTRRGKGNLRKKEFQFRTWTSRNDWNWGTSVHAEKRKKSQVKKRSNFYLCTFFSKSEISKFKLSTSKCRLYYVPYRTLTQTNLKLLGYPLTPAAGTYPLGGRGLSGWGEIKSTLSVFFDIVSYDISVFDKKSRPTFMNTSTD